jgi:hypothetical protein
MTNPRSKMNAERNAKPASTSKATRFAVLCAALALFVCLLAPSAASAKQARLFAGSFGATTSTVTDPYPLGQPWSVAADSSAGPSQGDVYVADGENHRVEKFDSSGHFLFMFGKGVNKGKVEEGGRTEAEQNLCAAGEECRPGTAGTAPGSFGAGAQSEPGIMFVAVDGSTGPSRGDVYVGDFSDATVTKFDESGHLISGWATGGQLDGSSVTMPFPGPFGQLKGIAVDPSGDLWVYGAEGLRGRVFGFGQDSTFLTDWNLDAAAQSPAFGIAATSEAVYLREEGGFVVREYTHAGLQVGIARSSPPLSGSAGSIATDPSTGDLYAGVFGSVGIERFDSSCHPQPGFSTSCSPVETFNSGKLHPGEGLAVDPSSPADTLYDASEAPAQVAAFSLENVPVPVTAEPAAAAPTEATLAGTVDPGGEPLTACFFEWGETTAYGHHAECEPAAAAIGAATAPVEVHAHIAGLVPGQTYHYRLTASNAATDLAEEPQLGQDLVFGPPTLAGSVADVTATAATFRSEVDPRGADTSYQVEYGTQPGAYDQATTFTDIGSPSGAQDLSAHVQGLLPGTLYHYRVLARNGFGPTEGPDLSFTTQPLGTSLLLPDSRAWELVSPPDKHGAALRPIDEHDVIQAAAAGDAFTYVATAPTESGPQGNSNEAQILSSRTAAGWSSLDLAAPHRTATGFIISDGQEFRAFSPDLSSSILQPIGAFEPALSPEATEQTPFLRTDFPPGAPASLCAVSCLRPLVTAANVAEGVRFGNEGKCPPAEECGPEFVGASPDLTSVVLTSPSVGLTSTPGDHGGLYLWSAGSLRLLSALPGGAPAPGNVVIGTQELHGQDARNAVVADGSRVIWSEAGGNSHLYLRYNAGEEQSQVAAGDCAEPQLACTIQLDAVQPGAGAGGPQPRFQFASADGSRVFFTDTQRLTADSGGSEGHPDLYLCRIVVAPGGDLECALEDLTPETGAEAAGVQGLLLGASADGSTVYFVANGALASGAVPGDCATDRVPGQTCNLYRWHQGTTTFIGVLSGADGPSWGRGGATGLTARVSPDGRWLAFMSQRPLTGYDNRDAVSGQPDEEVFLYHAPAGEGEAGRLLCASCDPTGARPRGVEYGQIWFIGGGLAGGRDGWEEHQWIAANIPGWTPYKLEDSLYQSRYLSDSGRLFFNSSDALVPADTNGNEDVYEFEPLGGEGQPASNDCTPTSLSYGASSGGCVDLISSGTSSEESAFLDASESGDDVFFLTNSKLSPQDLDSSLDVYDAHVCSAALPCPPPAPPAPPICEGDACQQPAVPPNDATPGSLTFNGAGNLTECPKGKKLQKGKCVKKKQKSKKHKKNAHKKSKNKSKANKRHANSNRRAGK